MKSIILYTSNMFRLFILAFIACIFDGKLSHARSISLFSASLEYEVNPEFGTSIYDSLVYTENLSKTLIYAAHPNATLSEGLINFCHAMDIDPVNCSCTQFPEFCDFVKEAEQTKQKHSETEYKCDTKYNYIRAGANIFGASLGIIGNGAVVVITMISWERGTRYNQLIIGLAVTDFLFSFNQLVMSIPLFWTCQWLYADIMCKIFSASVDMSVSIAMGFILIIALERYMGILYPFNNGFTQTKFWLAVGLNIVLGFTSVVPMLMYLDVGEYRVCKESWPSTYHSRLYSWAMLIVYFIVPVFLTLIMYFRIIRKLHITRLMFGKQSSALGEHSTSRRIKDNRRIMAILISVLTLFIILVLPNKLVWILLEYIDVNGLSEGTYRMLSLLSTIPYSFHVCVNPIIYSFIDSKFRVKVANLCCLIRQRSNSISSAKSRTSTKLTTTRRL